MEKVSTIGLDIAKNVFQVHGVDDAGRDKRVPPEARDCLFALAAQPDLMRRQILDADRCILRTEWQGRYTRVPPSGHNNRAYRPPE